MSLAYFIGFVNPLLGCFKQLRPQFVDLGHDYFWLPLEGLGVLAENGRNLITSTRNYVQIGCGSIPIKQVQYRL